MSSPFRPLAVDYLEFIKIFPLLVYPVEEHRPIASHRHGRFAELAIITDGSARHQSEAGWEPISKGDVLAIPVGRSHGYGDCEHMSLINILFDPHEMALPLNWQSQIPGYDSAFAFHEQSSAAARLVSRFRLSEQGLARAVQLCARIHDETVEQRGGYQAAAKGLFCVLLAELCRHEGTSESPVSEAMIRLSDLLGWLNRNYGRQISTAVMADYAHMSRSTLERHFREAFGKPPREFLIELRLRKAAELLHFTDADVGEVAAQVGLSDPSHFARLFRKHRGVSPSEYRKRGASQGRPSDGG
jgi:AraC-like DNA-binding protein